MNDGEDIQYRPVHSADAGIGFEGDGELVQRVPVVEPEIYREPDETTGQRADTMEAIKSLVSLLTQNSSALRAGQNLHLLAYWLGVSECKTHAELASKLNVSPGRVSQIIAEFPSELASLRNLKRRTAKAQTISEGQ